MPHTYAYVTLAYYTDTTLTIIKQSTMTGTQVS